jgi:APA family basic amino acid/polyamine antiporter
MLLLMIPAFRHAIGMDVVAQLSVADPAAYGFAATPAYPELIGIASGSALIGAIAIIGFASTLVIWLPQMMILTSRNIFAWSFDRVTPDRLTYVHPKTRSPVVAIGLVVVAVIASTAIYSFTDWFSSLTVLFGLTIPLFMTAVAGIVLPFTQRALVENSPYNGRVAGIPVLSVVGGLAALGFGAVMVVLLWDEGSGTSLSANSGKVLIALGLYLGAVALWFVARAVRRRQGIDIDLAYRELPAE